MRRKELKKKNLKGDFSGKSKNYKITRIFRKLNKKILAIKFNFVYALERKRTKKLYKLNFKSHYIFYKNFVNDFKLKKGNLFYKTLLKNDKFIVTQPAYAFKKQFTTLRVNTIDFENNYFNNSIPIFYKRLDFFNIDYSKSDTYVGLNYYSFYKKISSIDNFKNDLLKDENKNISFLKYYNDEYINEFHYDFQYFINYNIYKLNSLEIYKLLIYLHINKIIN